MACTGRGRRVRGNAAQHKLMCWAALPASGQWDSNPQPSAWEADALPLSYARACGRESTTALCSIKPAPAFSERRRGRPDRLRWSPQGPGVDRLFRRSPAVAEAFARVESGLLAQALPRLAQQAPRAGAEGAALLLLVGVHFDPPLPTTPLIDTWAALSTVRISWPGQADLTGAIWRLARGTTAGQA